jgi:hypothetical protein
LQRVYHVGVCGDIVSPTFSVDHYQQLIRLDRKYFLI